MQASSVGYSGRDREALQMKNRSKLYRPLRSKKRRHIAKRIKQIEKLLGLKRIDAITFLVRDLSPEMQMTDMELAS